MARVCWIGGLLAGLLLGDQGGAVKAEEPAAGSRVTVAADGTRLMLGSDVVAQLEEGRSFQVTRVIDGWLGAVIERDGQQLKGWVWHAQVLLAGSSDPAVAEPAAGTYRRMSYEPAGGSMPLERMARARGLHRPGPPETRLRPGSGR